MRPLRRLVRRVSNFASIRRSEERLREEIRSHLAAQTEEKSAPAWLLRKLADRQP
jgi:hypothetical protein